MLVVGLEDEAAVGLAVRTLVALRVGTGFSRVPGQLFRWKTNLVPSRALQLPVQGTLGWQTGPVCLPAQNCIHAPWNP